MPPKQKVTHPDPQALAALVARMAWFFAKREVEREQRKSRKNAKCTPATRRTPTPQA